MPPKIPSVMPAVRIRRETPFGHLHVSIVVDPRADKELEVFAWLGKCGEMTTTDLEGICRITSLYLRSGGDLRDIVKQLTGIGTKLVSDKIGSVPDSLGQVLEEYLKLKNNAGSIAKLLLGESAPAAQ